MTIIRIIDQTGNFAENKDVARDMRLHRLLPAIKQGSMVILDFSGIEAATQSFIHALISDPIRQFGPAVLKQIRFKGCSPTVKQLIIIVTEYMQA